jgi:hypothetical protein
MQGVLASSSTATTSMLLRLVDCPRCGVRLVRIRSKKPETYGEVIYKCPTLVPSFGSIFYCHHEFYVLSDVDLVAMWLQKTRALVNLSDLRSSMRGMYAG